MAERNQSKKFKNPTQARIVVNITRAQKEALDAFRATQKYKPEISQIVHAALAAHFGENGAVWPEAEE